MMVSYREDQQRQKLILENTTNVEVPTVRNMKQKTEVNGIRN